MKTAIVCLTTKHELHKAARLLVQASAQYPDAQPVFCLLDCAVPQTRPDGYLFLSGETLFGADNLHYAFSLRRDEYTALCSVRVLQGLFLDYDSVVLLRPDMCDMPLPKYGFMHDGIMLQPQRLDSTLQPLPQEVSLLNTDIYSNAFAVFCNGERTQRFLSWCGTKMVAFMRRGVSDCEEDTQANISQRSFFTTWRIYATLFGCGLVVLDAAPTLPAPDDAYAYNTFRDGTAVPLGLRFFYGADYRLRRLAGSNPFVKLNLFTTDSCIPGDDFPVPICAAAKALYVQHMYISWQFPSLEGEARLAYLDWFCENAAQHGYSAAFTKPTLQALQRYRTAEAERLAQEEAARAALVAKQEAEAAEAKKNRGFLGALFTKEGEAAPAPAVPPVEVAPATQAEDAPALPHGVNLIGCLCGNGAYAETARNLARMLKMANIPVALTEVQLPDSQYYTDTTYAWEITNTFPYDTNLFVLNPPEMADALRTISTDALQNRRNIGYWAWDMQDFPAAWAEDAALLDTVWTTSEFSAAALRRGFTKPVLTLPPAAFVAREEGLTRADFGLPEDRFLFLTMADMTAPFGKDPTFVAEAFHAAFGNDDRVHLVIKLRLPLPMVPEAVLPQWVFTTGNIHVIAENLAKPAITRLISLCDTVISIPHTDAFARGVAESMAQGIPVITTEFGAQKQYLRAEWCRIVPYTLTQLRTAEGAHTTAMYWASPDVTALIEAMKKLVNDAELRTGMRNAAKRIYDSEFSAEAAAPLLRTMLDMNE